jgi:hypothetical protein
MEHASIAANARFALELLSLGAPPELVEETYQAMADETVHARDACALASAYAGHAVGPGALDISQALAAGSPIDIVRTAILEGCIGETDAELGSNPSAPDSSVGNDGLGSFGVLDAETRREIRRRVLLEVIEPCARALLAKTDMRADPADVRAS